MKKKTTYTYNRKAGFSLAELAISFTVISILVGGVLASSSRSMEAEKYVRTTEKMQKIAKALRIYVNARNHLPCPAQPDAAFDNGNLGRTNNEDTNDCPDVGSQVSGTRIFGGAVPTLTLGLSPDYMFDEWGRRLSYVVDADATTGNIDSLSTTSTVLNIRVINASGVELTSDIVDTNKAAYALISHGVNGYLAANARGGSRITASTYGNNETENCPTSGLSCTWNETFVQNAPIRDTTRYFDDILIYKLKDELR